MEYTKEILKTYIEKLVQDTFAAEVSLEDNKSKVEKLEKEKEELSGKLKEMDKDLAELTEKRKKGIKDKEAREENKVLATIVEEKYRVTSEKYSDTEGRIAQFKRQIELYEEFLVTAEECIEIAKNKVKK